MINKFIQRTSALLGITPDELKKATIIPLALLILIVVGDIIWRSMGFPDPKETIELIKKLFLEYGYPLIFLAAFIEAVLLVGLYIPGSVALILAATMAGQGILNIWMVIILITLGMILAVVTNYALGRYGWYRLLAKFGLTGAIEKMKVKADAKGIRIIHLTYFNPNLASLSATSLGILRINFLKFFLHSVTAFIYWNTFWGFSFFFFGNWVESHLNYTSVVTAIVLLIVIRIGYAAFKKRYRI